MGRRDWLALAVFTIGCTTGGSGAGTAAIDVASDTAVDATADHGAADTKPVDSTVAETAADAALDGGAVEALGDAAQGDAAADDAVDAGSPDVAADLGKEVADAAPADVLAVDLGAPDSAADAKAEVAEPKDGQCTAEVGCKNAMMCIAPGESIGCGMCMKPEKTCDSDAACSPPDTVCKPLKCACGGESTCQPGCKVAADCAEGFFCAPTGKCVEDACQLTNPPGADKNCKPNFVCKNPANPHCSRKECKASTECEGYCVKGLCYSAPGQCSYPPP